MQALGTPNATQPNRRDPTAPVIARSLPADVPVYLDHGCKFKAPHVIVLQNLYVTRNHPRLLPELNSPLRPPRTAPRNLPRHRRSPCANVTNQTAPIISQTRSAVRVFPPNIGFSRVYQAVPAMKHGR
jgi:hypothetical protein